MTVVGVKRRKKEEFVEKERERGGVCGGKEWIEREAQEGRSCLKQHKANVIV